MSKKIPLAKYLFDRLRQQNVSHIHGVPGDYTLQALDFVRSSGLKWVGSCNELNAAYAADGYARIRGLGALCTTYGVGELSAINGIGGAYAEHVPVVHIVGSPSRRLQERGALTHHALDPGKANAFQEIHKHVTVAQELLWDAEKAPEQIDRVIGEALRQRRPVYLNIPSDMTTAEVDAKRLDDAISVEETPDEQLHITQADKLLDMLYKSRQPLLLIDRGSGIDTIKDQLNELVRKSNLPALTMPSGNSMIDHSLPSYFGTHSGPAGYIDTMPYLNSSDLVLAFGPIFSDTQTFGWSIVPDAAKTITIGKNFIQTPDSTTTISASRLFDLVLSRLDVSRLSRPDTSSLGDFRSLASKIQAAEPSELITQTTLFFRMNRLLRPSDILVLANATPILGGRDMVLPGRCRSVASGIWYSIGAMLPGAQGIALAQQEHDPSSRTVLLEGDGSFQCTAQELSTIMQQRLNVTIFMFNNEGYAYERLIWGMEEKYNDVASWDYLKAPEFFRPPEGYSVYTKRVKTWGELEEVLDDEKFNDGKGLKLVELCLGRHDVPENFRAGFLKVTGNL